MFGRSECRRVSPLLWEHAEGALRDSEMKAVEQHLKRCPACTRALAKAQKLQNGLSAYRTQELPASKSTWHALRTQLEATNQRTAVAAQRRSFRVPVWAATAAAGVVAALVVVPFLTRPAATGRLQISRGGGINPAPKEIETGGNPISTSGHEAIPVTSHPKNNTKGNKTSPKPGSRGGEIENAIVRNRVKPQYRQATKSQPKNSWNDFKPNRNANAEFASIKREILPADMDGARPSNPGRDYVMNPEITGGRGSRHEYVMGTIGDSRARIIPASQTSEENSVW